jgi:protein TonB
MMVSPMRRAAALPNPTNQTDDRFKTIRMHSTRADFDPEAGQWKFSVLAIVISAVLHGAFWSLRPNLHSEPRVTPPQVIEVALIAPQAAPQQAQPQVQPPPEPVKPQPKPKQPAEKPAPKKPVKPKPAVQPPPKPAPPVEPAPEPVQAPAAPGPAEAPVQTKAAAPAPAPFVEASYRSPSLNNPPTRYPRLALERQWEGTVTLRVQVLASGSAGEIRIERSSGHEILDEATVEQVKSWRFVPARRGDQSVVSWVIIPIQYKLKH